MKLRNRKILYLLLALFLLAVVAGALRHAAGQPTQPEGDLTVLPAESLAPDGAPAAESAAPLDEAGSYTAKEDVALYLHTYGHLPPNFITKAEARRAGWPGGSLEEYCPGKCIGGDRFGNREGRLPDAEGRVWYECDVNTLGAASRGGERIVWSSDGLIYYTGDHYESFELLYDK